MGSDNNSLILSDEDLNTLYGEEQAPFIHRHSGLAMGVGFCVLLRERFSQLRKTPWDSATSKEKNWVQDHSKATIFILNEYDEEPEIDNAFPRVTVMHDGTQYQRVTIGDEATEHDVRLRKGLKHGSQLGMVSFSLEVVSERRGECAMLADIVSTSVMICTDIISRMMNLRQVSPVTVSNVTRQDGPSGKNFWRATIRFTVDFEANWATIPIAPTLTHVELRGNVLGALAAETSRFRTIAISDAHDPSGDPT